MAGKVNMDDLQHVPAQVGVSDAAFEVTSRRLASKSCPEFNPDEYPPLPSSLETVQLPIISIDDLATPFPDKDSTLRLFEACKSPGIFYLKPPGKMSHDRDNLVTRATDWITKLEPAFHLPMEEKKKYCFIDSTRIFGYKEVGATVVDDVGTGDTSEFWNVRHVFVRDDAKLLTRLDRFPKSSYSRSSLCTPYTQPGLGDTRKSLRTTVRA